jgi:hypothetical protein
VFCEKPGREVGLFAFWRVRRRSGNSGFVTVSGGEEHPGVEAGASIDDLLEWFDGLDREQVRAVIQSAGVS